MQGGPINPLSFEIPTGMRIQKIRWLREVIQSFALLSQQLSHQSV